MEQADFLLRAFSVSRESNAFLGPVVGRQCLSARVEFEDTLNRAATLAGIDEIPAPTELGKGALEQRSA
jgi:hypothetical protein